MQLEARKYLYDIKQAADLLGEFTGGKQFSDYKENSMLRAAVERKFEIIGEALSKLSKADSAMASHIGEHARIIAFRNILIHGYAEIDDRLVWDIVENKLPVLRSESTNCWQKIDTAEERVAQNMIDSIAVVTDAKSGAIVFSENYGFVPQKGGARWRSSRQSYADVFAIETN